MNATTYCLWNENRNSILCPRLLQGEKVLLLLHEEELLEEDFIVFLQEFIMGGSISHLFTYEEQTTIINSIRTEVTQAGLTYTRDVAWNFFLRWAAMLFIQTVCLNWSSGFWIIYCMVLKWGFHGYDILHKKYSYAGSQ